MLRFIALLLLTPALAASAAEVRPLVLAAEESCEGDFWTAEGEACRQEFHVVGAEAESDAGSWEATVGLQGERRASWTDGASRDESEMRWGAGARGDGVPDSRVDAMRCGYRSDVAFGNGESEPTVSHAGSDGCAEGAFVQTGDTSRDVEVVRCETTYAAEGWSDPNSGFGYAWTATGGTFSADGAWTYSSERRETCFVGVATEEAAVGYERGEVEACETESDGTFRVTTCDTYPDDQVVAEQTLLA